MDQLNSESMNNTQSKEIVFDFDSAEVDFNNIEFKPVNKGLGFHHKEEKHIVRKSLVKEAARVPKNRKFKAKTLSNSPVQAVNIKRADRQLQMSPPPLFDKKILKNSVKITNKKKAVIVEANSFVQFGAWLLDLILICIFVAITSSALVLVAGININDLLEMVSMKDVMMFVLALFASYYLAFFTIFDLVVSPGKSLCNIKLVAINDKQVTPKNTFLRAFITLVSLGIAGLPAILDFQGKLSDSKVIKS